MENSLFTLPLYLPAQGAAESDATIVQWRVVEGDCFEKGEVLGQIDSAKSVFDFEAPCDGRLVRLLRGEGETVAYDQAVMEIETADPAMKEWIPPAAQATSAPSESAAIRPRSSRSKPTATPPAQAAVFRGFGGYLPERIVTNAEVLQRFPNISEDYVYQVTGIRQRHWAADGEKPSDMAYAASVEAIRKAGLDAADIDAVILATTTPDVAMPSTACILQARLGLRSVPAFDLNAACSGWLYTVAMARNMIACGMARHVLTVGVDVQSRLLDRDDQSTNFIFGDGAGAAIVSAEEGMRDSGLGIREGMENTRPIPNPQSPIPSSPPRIREIVLGADPRGLYTARRCQPGYRVTGDEATDDPWIRIDGQTLFRMATESFAKIIRETIEHTGWKADDVRWVVPHQANLRIIKAAAKRSGVPFDRFFLNVDRIGNTSSASIVLALIEMEEQLCPGDKLIFCSVGAGLTNAAVSVEW